MSNNKMNRLLAEQIMGIENEPFINLELLKKQYRKKASEMHPDKFQSEPEKLKTTRSFIRMKDAYTYLLKYVTKNGSYKTSKNEDIKEEKSEVNGSTYKGSHTSTNKADEDHWYGIFSILLIPGGLIPMGVFFMSYIIYEDVKKSYESDIGSFLIVLLQVLILIFILVTGIYYVIRYALDGRIFPLVLIIQILATLVYYGICYLYRKFLEFKYIRNESLSISIS